jgi:hypothetical protein
VRRRDIEVQWMRVGNEIKGGGKCYFEREGGGGRENEEGMGGNVGEGRLREDLGMVEGEVGGGKDGRGECDWWRVWG